MLNTTLNIHLDVFNKICETAMKYNRPRRDIIVMLLMRIMKDYSSHHRGFTTVKYQPDDENGNWHTFHISYKPAENEFVGDLRKLGKYSVSYLLAIAVNKYLSQIVRDINKGIDNYLLFNAYVIYNETVDGVISWRLYWGYPEKELKTLRL